MEVQKWKECMKKSIEIDEQTWYFIRMGTESCKNVTQFINIPIVKTARTIFVNSKKNPFTVVLIGSNVESHNKLTAAFPKDSVFYGTHLNSSNIFSEYQKLENYLNSSISTEDSMNIFKYLNTGIVPRMVDLLDINIPINNYEVFQEFSTERLCQIKLKLDLPDPSNKKKLIGILSEMISGNRFLLLSFQSQELFLVNYENLNCRKKYLESYIH